MAKFGPVLLTGWNSYVGQAVMRAAEREEVALTLLLNDAAAAADAVPLGRPVRIAAPHDVAATSRAVRGHEAVIHVTTLRDAVGTEAELLRTSTMLAALDDGAALVMPGHAAIFGASDQHAARPRAVRPPPGLREAGRLAELLRQAAACGRRAFGSYSAFVLGGEGGRIARDWLAVSRRRGAVCHWDTPAQWSAIHVDDWASLMLAIASKGAPGEWPLFAHGQRVRVADMARAIAAAAGLALARAGAAQPDNPWHDLLGQEQMWPSDIETKILGWLPRRFVLEIEVHALCAQGLA